MRFEQNRPDSWVRIGPAFFLGVEDLRSGKGLPNQTNNNGGLLHTVVVRIHS